MKRPDRQTDRHTNEQIDTQNAEMVAQKTCNPSTGQADCSTPANASESAATGRCFFKYLLGGN